MICFMEKKRRLRLILSGARAAASRSEQDCAHSLAQTSSKNPPKANPKPTRVLAPLRLNQPEASQPHKVQVRTVMLQIAVFWIVNVVWALVCHFFCVQAGGDGASTRHQNHVHTHTHQTLIYITFPFSATDGCTAV